MLTLTLLGLLFLVVVGIAAPFLRPRRFALRFVHAAAGGIALVLAALGAVRLLAGGEVTELSLPVGLPWMGTHLRLDDLSCFFLVAINLPTAMVMVFAQSYVARRPDPMRVAAPLPIFLAAANLVPIADDAVVFLFAFGLMSTVAWLLVIADHREAENRQAAYAQLAMAAFGALLLMLAFGALAGPEGDYRFSTMREAAGRPVFATLAVVLAILGVGSKSGLVPLHIWLPPAQAAAPAHVSALLSVVSVGLALYGLTRILFDLIGGPVWWWGMALMLAGAATALVGVLYALVQRDLARLLATAAIANVGISVFALGLALSFRGNELFDLSAMALTAALTHILNQAFFMGLLFCGTGVVRQATRLCDIDRLGGLIRRMPYTGLFMLLGALAASGLPPLNGFVSEWLILQSAFASSTLQDNLPRLAVPIAAAVLMLAFALMATAFVRAFGLTFLGRPRSDSAARAVEPGGSMSAGLALLAGTCLLFGVFPVFGLALAESAAHGLVGIAMPKGSIGWIFLSPLGPSGGVYAGLIVFLSLLVCSLGTKALFERLQPERRRRTVAWDGGFGDLGPETQPTASGFSQPIRRVFAATAFRAREIVEIPPPGDTASARLEVRIADPAWDWGIEPLRRLIDAAATRLHRLQFLSIRAYLSLTFGLLIVLLLLVAAGQ